MCRGGAEVQRCRGAGVQVIVQQVQRCSCSCRGAEEGQSGSGAEGQRFCRGAELCGSAEVLSRCRGVVEGIV
jgi:hypothetical protein